MSEGNVVDGASRYSFAYNAFGQRVSKSYSYSASSVGPNPVEEGQGTSYSKNYYYDHAGRLVAETSVKTRYNETALAERIVYLYDESGMIGMEYTPDNDYAQLYYFQRNLLGDVVAIYDTSGALKVKYLYDAWGNCTIASETTNQALAKANPIRYRGYYYDDDTGLYYCNARYYSPKWRRFISPDDTAYLDPETVNGLNLYCYCNNDPVNFVDPSGHMVISLTTLLIGGLVAGAIGATIGLGSAAFNDYKEDGICFNGDWTDYVGRIVGGFVAGFGVGVCTVLGAGVGAAALGGTTATLFTSTGVSLSLGSALGIGSGVAFATGMAGYSLRTAISQSEDFKLQNMLVEGAFNAMSGALSVLGGALGGLAGFHNTVFTKLLSKKGDFWFRLLIENVFTAGFKLTNSFIKPYFMN